MKKIVAVVCASLAFGLLGCAPEVKTNTIAQFNAEYQRVKGQGYLIQPGDTLDITFIYTPEYNALAVPVRPDGMIQLSLVGDYPIAGKTPDQAVADLKQVYSSQLKNPDLAIIVKQFGANAVTVQGEVSSPGEIPITGNTTAIQAISKAGSFRSTGDPSRVTVVRRTPSGQSLVVVLDLRAAMQGLAPAYDVPLLPGDQIFVPPLKAPDSGGKGLAPVIPGPSPVTGQ